MNDAPRPIPPGLPGQGVGARSPSLVILGRVLLLLLAALAAAWAFALGRRDDRATTSARARYVCPMHPEVTSPTPDDCSICGMALERVGTAGRDGVSAEVFSIPEVANPKTYQLVARAERRVFAQEVRAPAWLEASGLLVALLYREDLTGISPDEHAVFFRATRPADGIRVHRTTDPPAAWDESLSRVHFRLDPGEPVPSSGEVGWLTLAARPRELLVVPSRAVVSSPEGRHVLVVSKDGRTFTRRPVEIGRASRGFTVVTAGLGDQERLVVGNTFFLDAARRLQSERKDEAVVR